MMMTALDTPLWRLREILSKRSRRHALMLYDLRFTVVIVAILSQLFRPEARCISPGNNVWLLSPVTSKHPSSKILEQRAANAPDRIAIRRQQTLADSGRRTGKFFIDQYTLKIVNWNFVSTAVLQYTKISSYLFRTSYYIPEESTSTWLRPLGANHKTQRGSDWCWTLL